MSTQPLGEPKSDKTDSDALVTICEGRATDRQATTTPMIQQMCGKVWTLPCFGELEIFELFGRGVASAFHLRSKRLAAQQGPVSLLYC
jgi:hypothetical protein